MHEPMELLDKYGLEDPADGDFGKVTVEECAPRAFDALRAVLDHMDRQYESAMRVIGLSENENSVLWAQGIVTQIDRARELVVEALRGDDS